MEHNKRSNKHVIGIPKGREVGSRERQRKTERKSESKSKREREETVKEIVVKSFLKLMKDIKILYQIKVG